MNVDNRVRVDCEGKRCAGQGRATGENWENRKWTTVIGHDRREKERNQARLYATLVFEMGLDK